MNRILDRMVAVIVTMTKITYPRRIERKLVEPESFREALISIAVYNKTIRRGIHQLLKSAQTA